MSEIEGYDEDTLEEEEEVEEEDEEETEESEPEKEIILELFKPKDKIISILKEILEIPEKTEVNLNESGISWKDKGFHPLFFLIPLILTTFGVYSAIGWLFGLGGIPIVMCGVAIGTVVGLLSEYSYGFHLFNGIRIEESGKNIKVIIDGNRLEDDKLKEIVRKLSR